MAPPLTAKENKLFFSSKGLPIPGSGAIVKPLNEMSNKKSILKLIEENKKNGFVDSNDIYIKTLMNFDDFSKEDYKTTENEILPEYSTHLRHTLSELKLAYEAKTLPDDLVNKTIGYAPESIILPNGWAGYVEFFTPKDFVSVCAYHETNIELTGSSAIFAKESVQNIIPNKINSMQIEGNVKSGFIYIIDWWDKTYRKRLECVAKGFDLDLKKSVIKLAVAIDKE
jgi:hypothetical protein